MRSSSWARWATCALAISIAVPATVAFARGKSLAECTTFDQQDKGDDAVTFTVKNSCTIPIDCSLSWRVVCAPDSKKRRAAHVSAFKLSLASGVSDTKEASASLCGDAGWAIDSIKWSCQPTTD